MNIQRLQEKILSFTSMDEPYKSKSIKDAFSEYECQQSKKSEESQIKENKQVLTNDFLFKLIEGMKKEIEALKKQVEAIDKVKVIDSNLKPKQERFYTYQAMTNEDGFCIVDSSQKVLFKDYYSKIKSNEICHFFNSLEASK